MKLLTLKLPKAINFGPLPVGDITSCGSLESNSSSRVMWGVFVLFCFYSQKEVIFVMFLIQRSPSTYLRNLTEFGFYLMKAFMMANIELKRRALAPT